MNSTFPFLTSYDPLGASEGTLDPLGLYQIADQLAVQLVPGVRERMQRIRFLTAMAVGSLVTEDLEDNPELRDASPYLVWKWLVVEALIRIFKLWRGVWSRRLHNPTVEAAHSAVRVHYSSTLITPLCSQREKRKGHSSLGPRRLLLRVTSHPLGKKDSPIVPQREIPVLEH